MAKSKLLTVTDTVTGTKTVFNAKSKSSVLKKITENRFTILPSTADEISDYTGAGNKIEVVGEPEPKVQSSASEETI